MGVGVSLGTIPTRHPLSNQAAKGAVVDIKQKIARANEEVAKRLIQGEPVLVDIAPAGEVIPGM